MNRMEETFEWWWLARHEETFKASGFPGIMKAAIKALVREAWEKGYDVGYKDAGFGGNCDDCR